ncbi:hypothetical protein EBR96_11275, partial [bacterium]|nr:hypothetical protein [bacterium]
PDIRRQAYTADGFESALDAQYVAFLNNPTKGMKLDRNLKVVYWSPLIMNLDENRFIELSHSWLNKYVDTPGVVGWPPAVLDFSDQVNGTE